MPTLEEIRATFAADRFATEAAGCEIRLAEPGRAICAMTLHPHHLNAAGTPQGGAIFTVADFAFAVAVNAFAEQVTVSLQHGITFLAPARGKEIVAEARCVRSGRSTCFYTVTISDELETAVAHMTVNGFVTQQKMRKFQRVETVVRPYGQSREARLFRRLYQRFHSPNFVFFVFLH